MRTDEEVEQLVKQNLGLVGKVVSRTLHLSQRLPRGYDRDDLYSDGCIGLLSAAKTYDPTRGTAFSTYAYGCIGHAIVGALKRESRRQIECISLSVQYGEEEENPLEEQFADPDADPMGSALGHCVRSLLESAVGTLPERQAGVIRALYFEGDSVGQVAMRSRLSMQAVQNLHLMALRGLRRRLQGLGIRASEV